MFGIQQYLHNGNLENGKNQVADDDGIRNKIGSQILNFRIIIMERYSSLVPNSLSGFSPGYLASSVALGSARCRLLKI
jgi:hypothetical protein